MPPQPMPSEGAPPVPPQMPSTSVGDPSQMPQPATDGGDQPVTPEQKQTLLDLIDQIKEKMKSFGATSFAADNKTESMRRDLLRQVFERLQRAGVDLTDRQSVADFMTKLQQQNPQLAQGFEKAMEVLLGGPEGGQFATPQDQSGQVDPSVTPQNNMSNINPNETVPTAG